MPPNSTPNPTPNAGAPGPARWIFVAGGLLLAVGVGLIAVAVTSSDKVGVVDDNLVAGQLNATTSATPSAIETLAPSPTPKATRAKRARPTKSPTVEANPTAAVAEVTKKPKAKAKPSRPVAGTPYRLFNVRTEKCLGSMTESNTTLVKQATCGSAGKLRLQVTREVAGVTQYQLRDVAGANQCLDPPGTGSNGAGTELTANLCLEPAGDNQEWQLKDVGQAVQGREVFLVVNSASGLCLDVAGVAADQGDLADGANLTLFPCATKAEGFDDHRWTFN